MPQQLVSKPNLIDFEIMQIKVIFRVDFFVALFRSILSNIYIVQTKLIFFRKYIYENVIDSNILLMLCVNYFK